MGIEHAEIAASVAERAIASWPRGTPVAMLPRLRALTLEVILRICLSPKTDRSLRVLRDRVLALMDINGSPLLTETMLRRSPLGRRHWGKFLRQRAEVDALLLALINERRRSGEVGGDVLGLLLSARNPDGSVVPAGKVRDELMSVILAGHETTASQLCWAFQLLAHAPQATSRLAEEIDAGLETTFLRATVHEVLRHRPVFLFTIPRAVVRPVDIGGRTYRPPAHLLGCIYLMHHDPTVVAEPHRFRPERFVEASPSAAAWLPWGGGRKTCPGRHLALIEMQTVLRAALSQLVVSSTGRPLEHARWRGVIVTPHRGGEVLFNERRERRRMRPARAVEEPASDAETRAAPPTRDHCPGS